MELSYGWTSYLAQDLQDPRALKALTVLRVLPALRELQGPKAPQARRAPQVLKAQPVQMRTRLSSIPNPK